jgi:tRNA (cytidine32/uridine32-2'-O)-methyltransferase
MIESQVKSSAQVSDPLKPWLDRITIVMVRTSHPGNIGSAARAMKTMGLTDLRLVSPDTFPSEEANWLASGATDVLECASVFESLSDALADVALVIGTSARSRRIPTPEQAPDACAALASRVPAGQRVAILFGREASGLDNAALDLCHYHLSIPGNPDYSVLNVAMAIQIVCYEMRKMAERSGSLLSQDPEKLASASFDDQVGCDTVQQALEMHGNSEDGEAAGPLTMPIPSVQWDVPLASHQDTERFLAHLNETLIGLRFINPKNPRQAMRRFRRLFQRIHMDEMEVNLLRGLLTAVDKRLLEK